MKIYVTCFCILAVFCFSAECSTKQTLEETLQNVAKEVRAKARLTLKEAAYPPDNTCVTNQREEGYKQLEFDLALGMETIRQKMEKNYSKRSQRKLEESIHDRLAAIANVTLEKSMRQMNKCRS